MIQQHKMYGTRHLGARHLGADTWARGHLGAVPYGREDIWAQGHLGAKYVQTHFLSTFR